jgi:CRISPR-associated protein Csb2
VEAISLSSKDLLGDGWSAPPVLSWVDYARPANVFDVCTPRTRRSQREIHYLKYAVQSNVRPLIEETVSVAEKVRNHLMGIYRVKCGGDPLAASQNFSGKDKDGHTLSGHGHAFYLPVDEDGDGRIDHVIVESRSVFSEKEISALDSLRSVWQSNGREDLRFILTSLGSEVRPCESRSWVSATPFVTIRHYKKSWGNYEDWLKHEVMLECQYNDLPAPKDIYSISHTLYTNPAKRWAAFMRSRTGRQPLPGYGFILEFDQAVAGPFTLGSLGHYGLGLFIALREPLLHM